MKNINDLISDINKYIPTCDQEVNDKRIILNLIKKNKEDILNRECEAFHITSSGFTINKERTKSLMVYHNIYDSWSWIGGHADGDADLLAVACKEVEEETGVIHINPFINDIIAIDILTTSAHYKNGKYVTNHLHLNISYLIVADEKDLLYVKEDENSDVRWVQISEMFDMVSEVEIKKVYKKILDKIKFLEERKEK